MQSIAKTVATEEVWSFYIMHNWNENLVNMTPKLTPFDF